ncbi:translation initiation factor IF-2 [Streptomyces sp. NPDC048718]|uniref:translation initiation factor IF-2 n=1 Tax=Streptomyces sp. NPDC048718 TaxID=3365587 RepID=UPI00372366B1
MRRLLVCAPLLLLTVGCGAVFPSAEDKAADAARDVAVAAGKELYGPRPRTAEEVGRSASGMDGVEVLRVSGTSTRDTDGVEVILRTSGTANDEWSQPEQVTLRRCFAVRVSPKTEWGEVPRGVDCPDGPPLAFAPPPAPPRLPDDQELEAALPRVPKDGRADEAEVRRALATLHLDPAVHTEVAEENGQVGVDLSVDGNHYDPQECVLARVAPGTTEVWVPARIQRMYGEGGCSAHSALHPAPPPH